MSFLKDFLRFVLPKRRFSHNHGGRLISPYDLREATDEERILMLAGVARSPGDAAFLLRKFGTTSAKDVLKQVARRRPYPSVTERLGDLIARIDGHDPRTAREVYGGMKYEQPVVRVQYRYRGKHD